MVVNLKRMGEMNTIFYLDILKGREYLRDLGVDGEIILKKLCVRMLSKLIWLRKDNIIMDLNEIQCEEVS